jgi:hypothetical protein
MTFFARCCACNAEGLKAGSEETKKKRVQCAKESATNHLRTLHALCVRGYDIGMAM